jgi:hypothetical protein
MRYLVGFVFVLALGVVGCGYDCTTRGCLDVLSVSLEPEVGSTYDVDLVLDDVVGAFTCTESDGQWSRSDLAGSVPEGECGAYGFDFPIFGYDDWELPSSVEISVEAQDGSWSGSVNESPNYTRYYPNGPKCDDGCRSAGLTIANDVGASEVQP